MGIYNKILSLEAGDKIGLVYDLGTRRGKYRECVVEKFDNPHITVKEILDTGKEMYRQYNISFITELKIIDKKKEEKQYKNQEEKPKEKVVVANKTFEEIRADIINVATAEELAKCYKILFPDIDIKWNSATGKFDEYGNKRKNEFVVEENDDFCNDHDPNNKILENTLYLKTKDGYSSSIFSFTGETDFLDLWESPESLFKTLAFFLDYDFKKRQK